MAHYNDSCKNGPFGNNASQGGFVPELLRRTPSPSCVKK